MSRSSGEVAGGDYREIVALAFAVIQIACSGGGSGCNTATDCDMDSAEQDPVDSSSDPTGEEADALEDMPGDSSDPDAFECFTTFEDGWDIAALGFPVIELDRTPTECGHCCKQVTFPLDEEIINFTSSINAGSKYLAVSYIGTSIPVYTYMGLVDVQATKTYRLEYTYISSPEYQRNIYPAIWGASVYYVHSFDSLDGSSEYTTCEIKELSLESGAVVNIYEYDICYGLDTSSCWCPFHLDASDNYLAWEDNRDATSAAQRVRIFDLVSLEETTISERSVSYPAVSGSTVVYDYFAYSPDVVNIYDITTGTTTTLTDGLHDRWHVSMSGRTIVWDDLREGGYYSDKTYSDIYMMDLDDGTEIPVCTNPASQFYSDVSEDLVVWVDLRDDPVYPNSYTQAENWNVYAMRRSTGVEIQVTDMPGREEVKAVWGRLVYFEMEDDAGIKSIFVKEIPPP